MTAAFQAHYRAVALTPEEPAFNSKPRAQRSLKQLQK